MEETPLVQLSQADLAYLDYNGPIYMITLAALVITVIYSLRQGNIRDLIENVFLCFLLVSAFMNAFTYPVDTDDEITAGIFFMAFGLCRIAKDVSTKKDRS